PDTAVDFEMMNDTSCLILSQMKAMENTGFIHMTEIQALAIPTLLEGRDLVGVAKTVSDKTLAFLIPAVKLIYRWKFMPYNGTGGIIISTTRERPKCKNLEKGSISVTTPKRLLNHLQNILDFFYKNFQRLIIGEADLILDIEYEEELKSSIFFPVKRRQTILFSATHTQKVAIIKKPIYVEVDDDKEMATVEGLQQGYIACPSEKRFLLLFMFLKKNKKKMMVFFNSCMSVKYYHELLNYIDLPMMSIHSKQKQTKRITTFHQFCNASSRILLFTDVAARDLDIPDVNWEYIRRIGRTARGDDSSGHALLILRPEELGFLHYLEIAHVSINEYKFSWNKIAAIQLQLEKLISKNYFLHQLVKEAFKNNVRAYYSHHLKLFDIETLDLPKFAKSFGFTVPSAMDLSILNFHFFLFNSLTEVEISKSSRPQKRLYGHFKNINDRSSTKRLKRTKTFRQIGKRGQDNR
ncbi:putative ATP-dependent RNA helicase pitchoune, partial [Trachymyrmex cornetzi]